MKKTMYRFFSLILITITTAVNANTGSPNNTNDPNLILSYISDSWATLKRSMNDCDSFYDPKTRTNAILYLPAGYQMPDAVNTLKEKCKITVKYLPKKISHIGEIKENITPSGLLYLPYPYVVPGGMFNEMYGWDSYFIIRGLLENNREDIAHGIVENFFFEIDHYGGVLNGNRTYYLSRTQIPFLAPIIRAVYEADLKQHTAKPMWLAKAYQYALKDYNLWTHKPHLAGDTGLSRYYDFGDGPVPELDDSAKSYYEDVIRYFLLHPKIAEPYLLQQTNNEKKPLPGAFFNVSLCKSQSDKTLNKKVNETVCKIIKKVGLSSNFYKGDRAMRESGFDVSFRFGPFSADVLNYAPVDLNSLLYKAEEDLEWMSEQLGNKEQAQAWHNKARIRRQRINQYLWNEEHGLYFDYNFKTKKQSKHPYATTFYPLWTHAASKKQAIKVTKNLKLFEKPGGIVTSLRETGVQWDYPYGWAPIQLITVESLYQYGSNVDANRISRKFLQMVLKNFMREKTIREKYNVISQSSKTTIQLGYKLNVIGFGWTNGVFLVLLHKLPTHLAKSWLGLDSTTAHIENPVLEGDLNFADVSQSQTT